MRPEVIIMRRFAFIALVLCLLAGLASAVPAAITSTPGLTVTTLQWVTNEPSIFGPETGFAGIVENTSKEDYITVYVTLSVIDAKTQVKAATLLGTVTWLLHGEKARFFCAFELPRNGHKYTAKVAFVLGSKEPPSD
jgi:hypothetical protein